MQDARNVVMANYNEELNALLQRWVNDSPDPNDIEYFQLIAANLESAADAIRRGLPLTDVSTENVLEVLKDAAEPLSEEEIEERIRKRREATGGSKVMKCPMNIEEAEERIDNCLSAMTRAVPIGDLANREFWACVIDYLGRSAEYLREEVQS